MENEIVCPNCGSKYCYKDNDIFMCPECFNEWTNDEHSTNQKIYDSNNNELKDGDTVIIIKDLKVKGASKPLKKGIKVCKSCHSQC